MANDRERKPDTGGRKPQPNEPPRGPSTSTDRDPEEEGSAGKSRADRPIP
jgi:hypothetical protein